MRLIYTFVIHVCALIFEFRFDDEACKAPLQPEPVIRVSRPDLAFKLLRNFGHLIVGLSLDYVQFNKRYGYSKEGVRMIEGYLERYCCETLSKLSLQYYGKFCG